MNIYVVLNAGNGTGGLVSAINPISHTRKSINHLIILKADFII